MTYRGGAETGSLQDTADARLHICRKYLCRPVNLLYTGGSAVNGAKKRRLHPVPRSGTKLHGGTSGPARSFRA